MANRADLDLALRLADAADAITSARFTAGTIEERQKSDGSPVTDVDLEVEEELLGIVYAERPHDAFLGEEVGQAAAVSSSRRWIVDGIDGTESFCSGERAWGTLVALQVDDEIVVGVATSPGLKRRWWAAKGAGAWTTSLDGESSNPDRLHVSAAAPDGEPKVSVLPLPGSLDGWRDESVRHVAGQFPRPAVSGHRPLLVAEGRIEASVHLEGGPWDHAPFVVLVEEAGGRFTDLWGGRRIRYGDCSLHEQGSP